MLTKKFPAKLKREILSVIADWMEKRKNPFYLKTESSINLVDDKQLMHLMVKAGFEDVFIGIEFRMMRVLLNAANHRTGTVI